MYLTARRRRTIRVLMAGCAELGEDGVADARRRPAVASRLYYPSRQDEKPNRHPYKDAGQRPHYQHRGDGEQVASQLRQ